MIGLNRFAIGSDTLNSFVNEKGVVFHQDGASERDRSPEKS